MHVRSQEVNMDRKKILILSANPKTTARLSLGEEVREIEEGLKRSKWREYFEIKSKWAVRMRDLRRAILDEEPHILHFCGHRKRDGIMVEDELGLPVVINRNALAGLFKLFKDQIECVLLIACFSQFQSKAISKHIENVIGMKREIGDKAAIEFSVGFYDALGAGKSVEEAFAFGRNAVESLDKGEHNIPVFFNNISDDQPVELAVRSLRGYGDDLDDKVYKILCLWDYFEKRSLVKGTWEDIKEEIKTFLDQNIKPGKRYNFHFPLHISLAFFVGRELPHKRGAEINVYQSSPLRELWRRSKNEGNKEYPDPWLVEDHEINNTGIELAVAISVTNDIRKDVETFIRKDLPAVSQLLHIKLPKTSHDAVKNADHAFDFSYETIMIMKEKYRQTGASRMHLFISAPNIFNFQLGQHSLVLRNITLYDYDLESGKEGAYSASIQV